MTAQESNGRKSGNLRVRLALLALIVLAAASTLWAQQPAASRAQSLAAWDQVAAVLRHPRCLNCHQLVSPLQGDSRREHIPHVVRGADSHGVGVMRCQNCHNNVGNNTTSRTPGAHNWSLAPVSMLWQGLSSGDLCRMLKDPARNGQRSPEKLIKHMENEPLVLWGWSPGPGLTPVPVSHDEFVSQMKIWVAGGTACPK
jgi:hypothetical protein